MRPETKKLIQKRKAVWPDDRFGASDIIFVSDIQKIIDSETKPLLEEIEIWKERVKAERDINKKLLQESVNVIYLRDMFATRAPEQIPDWFSPKAEPHTRFISWRYWYADEMLRARDSDNNIMLNLEKFIANCEDIPANIKKVIDKEFFNML